MKANIKVIEKENNIVAELENSELVIFPFSIDENGSVATIGIIEEANSFFHDDTFIGALTVQLEKEEKILITKCIEFFEQISGYVTTNSDWKFLGDVNASKYMNKPFHCYAVNVTNLTKGDNEIVSNEEFNFKMIPLSEIDEIEDTLIHSCFFNLFYKLYKNEIQS